MRVPRRFTTSQHLTGMFRGDFSPGRTAKQNLTAIERFAIAKAARERGTTVEALAAAFSVSTATIVRIVNISISETPPIDIITPIRTGTK